MVSSQRVLDALSHLGQEGPRLRAEALRLDALEVIDKPTGAVSRDLRNTRGRIIRHTLRRVLGLPPVHEQADPLPPAGGSALASILAVDFGRLPSAAERLEATELVSLLNEHLALVHQVIPGHRGMIDGHLGGAGLDVYEREPAIHPGLLELPNVTLLPHVGSATRETRTRMAMLAARNAHAVLTGAPPLTPVP